MEEHCSDSEFQESEVDEEIIEKHKQTRKFLRKPRDHPPPLLQRNRSTDRASQQCIIEVQDPAEVGGHRGNKYTKSVNYKLYNNLQVYIGYYNIIVTFIQ